MNYKNQMVSCLKYQAAFFFFVNQALLLCEVYIFYHFYNFLICRLTSVGNVVIFMDKVFSVCHTLHLYAVFFLYIFRDALISLSAVFRWVKDTYRGRFKMHNLRMQNPQKAKLNRTNARSPWNGDYCRGQSCRDANCIFVHLQNVRLKFLQ